MGKRFYLDNGKEIMGLREARKAKGSNPSVTTVIDACAPHEYKWLDYQRLKEALEADATIDEKMDILGNQAVFETGTLIHAVAEAYKAHGLKSDPIGCPNSTRQMYKVLDQITHAKLELFLHSDKLRTGGRLDVIGKYKKKLTLADLKTCNKLVEKPKPIWKVQMGAYYGLCIENNIKIEQAIIIQYSKKDEGVLVLTITQKELEYALQSWKKLRGLFEYWFDI